MKLLVSGGAGFGGSHDVRTVRTGTWGPAEPGEVIVRDKLTCAGDMANLAPVVDFEQIPAATVEWYSTNGECWEPLKARAALGR